MNMNCVQHVVAGAKMFYSDLPVMLAEKQRVGAVMELKSDHVKIIKKLIKLGANTSAKDMAGRTPLHHCFGGYGNTTTSAMAELMLEAGADPNIQDRLGKTPLFLCINTAKLQDISLLLKHGADPDVKEYTKGLSSRAWAFSYPAVTKLFIKAGSKDALKERQRLREAAGGSLATCSSCGNTGHTRCAGCFLVHYCNTACQKEDWKKHRLVCKETRAKYKEAKIENSSVFLGLGVFSHPKQRIVLSDQKAPPVGHYVMKVHVTLYVMKSTGEMVESGLGHPLTLYNKDRSLQGKLARVAGQEELYDKLDADIRDHGFKRHMAFYPAINVKDPAKEGSYRLQINPEVMLPVETW